MNSSLTNSTTIGYTGLSTPHEIYTSRMFFFSGILCVMAYSVQAVFFVAALRPLWYRRTTTTGMSRWALPVVVISLFAANTIYVVTLIIMGEREYIDNACYPGGVLKNLAAVAVTPVDIISAAANVITCLMCDALLIWRAYVILNAMGLVGRYSKLLALPAVLLWIACPVFAVFFQYYTGSIALQYSPDVVKYATMYYSSSFALNIYLPLLIMLSIWIYQRKRRGILGHGFGDIYTQLTTIFLESAALYIPISLGVVVTFTTNAATNPIFLTLLPGMQTISSYLIIYRVSQGRSWDATARPSTSHFRGPADIMFRTTTSSGRNPPSATFPFSDAGSQSESAGKTSFRNYSTPF